jgi:N-acetylglucosamine kinase
MEKYFIGIDGGQTSLKCVLADGSGTVIGEGSGAGLIHLAAQGSRERYIGSLTKALNEAWHRAGCEPVNVAAIGLGLTGVEGGSPEAEIVRGLVAMIQPAERIVIENDAYAALVGAHEGKAGVIVIAGTGSIVLGQDNVGRRCRVGGWGWLVGDEGSAMAIGRDGLRAALHTYDGSGAETKLYSAFLQYFQIENYADVKRKIYASDFGSKGFATLAAITSQCASQGDVIASQIIQQHAESLAHQAQTVIKKLQLPQNDQCVSPMSGAFEHVWGLQSAFESALNRIQPSAIVHPPKHSALIGALFMAQRAA